MGAYGCSTTAGDATITKNNVDIVVFNTVVSGGAVKSSYEDWYGCGSGRGVVGITFAASKDVLSASTNASFYKLNF